MKKAQPQSKKSTAKPAGVRVAAPIPPPSQPELFEKGIALFRQGSFAEALVFFEKATEGPILEMGGSARAHARMCALRIERAAPDLKTADDHYNWGVALLNQRRFREAAERLEEARRLAPDGDHVHYALALSQGLGGDILGASQSLRRAIELQPRNRGQARNDPDFFPLLFRQPIAALLLIDNEGNS